MNCENEFDFNPEKDIIVDTEGVARSVLMDIGDVLIDLCKYLGSEEIKIKVSRDYDTDRTTFKAKIDERKVLEIKANDFNPFI